jgi:hypothetical protein
MIGRRTLIISTDAGPQPVEVTLTSPEPDGARWMCRYTIGWPEGVQVREVRGADGIAAVHSALQMIGLDLNSSSYHREGRLKWMEPWVGYGFPVPKGARDLLTGQDKEVFG